MLSGNEVALISPSREFASEFLEVARESVSAGEDRYRDLLATGGDFADYVADLERQEQGTGGTPDSVPQTTYWLRRADGGILGTVRLRHRLTPSLEVFGGNIGYEIRPAQRRKGYGTRILELVLEKARGHGLSRVLLTCYDDNVGSIRVIEKNGGQLSDRVSLDNGKSTDDTGSI